MSFRRGSKRRKGLPCFSATTGGNIVSRIVIDSFEALSDGDKIDWTSIPATYDRLEIELEGAFDSVSGSHSVFMTFNADTTASNYHYNNTGGYNGGASNGEGADRRIGGLPGGSLANAWGNLSIDIKGYNNTDRWTVSKGFDAYPDPATGLASDFYSHTWQITTTVNQIQLDNSAGDGFKIGSKAWLIGITYP